MRGLWESAFVVAAFAGSEAYASNRPPLADRSESTMSDPRHQHEHATSTPLTRAVIRPVLPAIRLTIR